MTDLAELLERCKTATGPDRELDGTLWWMVNLSEDQRKHHDPFGSVHRAIKNYGSAGRALEQFFDSSNPYCLARIAFKEPYTASVDASLALVERVLPGCLVSINQMPAQWQVTIVEVDPEHPGLVMADYSEEAPTAPLAIIAALLSAMLTAGSLK